MLNKNIWNTFSITEHIDVGRMEIDNLPSGISVSTMCATGKLNTRLNIPNIEKYFQLNNNDIITVKKNKEQLRTLNTIKQKPKRNSKKKEPVLSEKRAKQGTNHFYNQVTVVIRVSDGDYTDLNLEPRINMKLFKNGSVQMSGCKSIKNINIAFNKLFYRLSEVKAVIEDGNIVEKPFVEDVKDMNEMKVIDFKIDMINSNYQIKRYMGTNIVSMQVDRDKLFELLRKKKIKSSFEPCIRACVIIKYVPEIDNVDQKEVSIFVFQKGNIIITGARSRNHIISSYDYTNDIFKVHFDEIVKKNEEEDEILILELYKSVMQEVQLGLVNI